MIVPQLLTPTKSLDRYEVMRTYKQLLDALEDYMFICGYAHQDSEQFKKVMSAIKEAKEVLEDVNHI